MFGEKIKSLRETKQLSYSSSRCYVFSYISWARGYYIFNQIMTYRAVENDAFFKVLQVALQMKVSFYP